METNKNLADLLSLLFESMDGTANTSVLRRLAREHKCRFAWSCIRLDRISQLAPPANVIMNYRQVRDSSQGEELGFGKQALSALWLKQESSMLSSRFGSSSFIEQTGTPGWPSWLRFLIFISTAGRQVGAKLQSYAIPKLFYLRSRMRRKEGSAGRKGGDRGRDGKPDSRTLAELFRGHDESRPAWRKVRRRKMQAARRKELLLKMERALYFPDRDTILSLYRGRRCLVPAGIPKSRNRS